MMKKIILSCLCCNPLGVRAALDFSQDRPFSTDVPIPPSQLYYKAGNPTRPCVKCPHRKNRWARCNGRSLKIKNNNDNNCL
jgi:hypothetical protein